MTWLALAIAWTVLVAGLVWLAARWDARRRLRKAFQPARSRVDQLHAELHAREPAKVIVGPWMLVTTCPDCGTIFERPRIVTDQRCEPCKAKAWHAQEVADRENWEKSPGVVKMPDGKEVVMSDALIIRKDWGSK